MAEILLNIDAVGCRPFNPFTLTSGTRSPVYVDCRRLISFVEEREEAVVMLRDLVEAQMTIKPQYIAGGETAGIPFAAFLSWQMKLPMLYVRKQAKGFGKNAQVEGRVEEGATAILVEDLIFDGGSKINFVNGLRYAGLRVNHVFTLVSYALNEEYEQALGSIGVAVHSVTDWPTIVDVGERAGRFGHDESEVIRDFLKNPHAWSQARGGK